MPFLRSVLTFLVLLLGLALLPARGAELPAAGSIPLTADRWEFQAGKVEFLEYKSVPALKILPGAGPVVLKDVDFTDGTIEFDIELLDPRFANAYFRWRDAGENESFYFRTARAGNPTAGDAVQYTPTLGGSAIWDLLGHYQTHASFQKQAWIHVRLVVAGPQLHAYLNHGEQPVLVVPRLEGNTTHGLVAFEGEAIIANLVITPGAPSAPAPVPSVDPTADDAHYLRHWQVSPVGVIPPEVDFVYSSFPKPDTAWTPLTAERRGLVNLTRQFGKSEARRLVWVKTRLSSATAQVRKLSLGFNDEVWVFINGKLLYLDKNLYFHPIRKAPEGRCSIENTAFDVPLNAGDNELLIGIANNFYGWGLVARLDSLAGLTLPAP